MTIRNDCLMLLNRLTRSGAAAVVLAGAIALAGCGGSTAGGGGGASIPSMAEFYGEYLTAHRNQAPKDEQEFRAFLATKSEQLEKAHLTLDAMFVSPRGSTPLLWVYSGKPPGGPMGMSFYAYEQTPTDGKRLVIGARGIREEMDEARFKAVFPKAL